MKKINIFVLLIVLPNILGFAYDWLFRFSESWLGAYQNYFKLGFLVVSIIGTVWLSLVSKKEKSNIWFGVSIVVLILLLIYLYFAVAIINSSY